MGKILMIYLGFRNGVTIIIVIVYLYKIKKREKFFPKLDDPQLETGIKIIGGVLLAGVLVFCTIPAAMDIPNMIHEDYLYIEGMPEDKSNVAFYVKHGFQEFEGAGSIIICNPGKKE